MLIADFCRATADCDHKDLVKQVWDKHLVPTVDTGVTVQTAEQEKIRRTSLSTSTKLSRWLEAFHSCGRPDASANLAHQVETRLRTKFFTNGGFTYVEDQSTPSLLATAEAVVALHQCGQTAPDESIDLLLNWLASANISASAEFTQRARGLVSLWACSCIDEGLAPIDSARAKAVLTRFGGETHLHDIYDEHFSSREFGFDDYYSTNLWLLYGQSIVNLCRKGHLSQEWMQSIVGRIRDIASSVLSNGYFPSPKHGGIRFWEHYQAIHLLCDFLIEARKHESDYAGSYMYIKPTHFHKTNIPVEDDLITVLMPFGPEWSEDVYDAIQAAAQAKGFRVWRSDQESLDDNIVQTIWENINRAKVVVADCTGKNPNVFYELGIAHTLGKRVFICSQSADDIPFDLKSIRYFLYSLVPKKAFAQLGDNLQKFLGSI
ncbi:MAG TPA: hypothetical protein VHE55_05320 [Fimbriimonadaceae bacterium]|nr:hypothetical protein [Fimbriimonadaceae bacterium]